MESNKIEITEDIFSNALKAVDPYSAVEHHISHILSTYQNGGLTGCSLSVLARPHF